VAGDGFLVWLPGPLDRGLAEDLFALDGAESFARAGDLIARRAPAFALLQFRPSVVVQTRGGVAVCAWDASGAELRSRYDGAVRVVLGSPAPGAADDYPMGRGVMACASVNWSEPSATMPSAQPTAPAAEDSAQLEPPGFIAELPAWVAQGAPNPFAELWGRTMRRPVEAAAVREVRDAEAGPTPGEAPHAPVQTATASTATSPAEAPPLVVSPAQPAQPPVPPQPRPTPASTTMTLVAALADEPAATDPDWGELVASDGQRVAIAATVVLGRAPQPLPGTDCQLLRLPSPDRGISRSHVVVAVVDGRVRAKDLGSNNGTTLSRGNARVALAVDSWTELTSGDVLDLGESTTVRLVRLS
jgi:hypothetical protein